SLSPVALTKALALSAAASASAERVASRAIGTSERAVRTFRRLGMACSRLWSIGRRHRWDVGGSRRRRLREPYRNRGAVVPTDIFNLRMAMLPVQATECRVGVQGRLLDRVDVVKKPLTLANGVDRETRPVECLHRGA